MTKVWRWMERRFGGFKVYYQQLMNSSTILNFAVISLFWKNDSTSSIEIPQSSIEIFFKESWCIKLVTQLNKFMNLSKLEVQSLPCTINSKILMEVNLNFIKLLFLYFNKRYLSLRSKISINIYFKKIMIILLWVL